MATVLWLMYLADLSSSISAVCCILAIIIIGVWLFRWMHNDMEGDYGSPSRPPMKGLYIALALFSIAALLPSSKTVYAIAAVQAGDSFAGTERGEKVLKALDSWLDKQDKPD